MTDNIGKTTASYRWLRLSILLVAAVSFFTWQNFSSCLEDWSGMQLYEQYEQYEQQQQHQHQHQQQHQQQRQRQRQRQRLEFVHIPKTGGTAIESIAGDANITWSICHFGKPENILKISNKRVHCQQDNTNYTFWRQPTTKKFSGCPWWHVPPAYIKAFFPEQDPYSRADLFAVVRNPYERAISEYYYMIQDVAKNRTEMERQNSELDFNAKVHKTLLKFLLGMERGDTTRTIRGNNVYFMNSGHQIPQYDFIYGTNHQKVVEHVLRFETLGNDFTNLMAKYNLPLQLPTNLIRASAGKELGVYNLTRENMVLIETIYRDDFREFGYEVISPRIPRDNR